MTSPGAEGEAHITVRADTDKLEPDMERGLKKAAEGAEDEARDIGKDLGDVVAEGVETSLGKHGKDFAKSIEDGLDGERVRVRARFVYERDSRTGEVFRKRIFEDIKDGFEDAVEKVFASGSRSGAFKNLGSGFADAIGAGFNVSGRSPLIALLIPVILAIGNLITAIVVALQPLGAFLLSLPTLLASIGIQAGIVAIAFKGIGAAVQGAFAAQNAKELNEAIRSLHPQAQAFVLALLPLKGLFQDLKTIIQARFFEGIGTNISGLIKVLDPILRRGLWDAAYAVGQVFHELIDFFSGATFTNFVDKIFPLTVEWTERFGPAFVMFLEGLIAAATTLMPFLRDFGSLLSGELEIFGLFLKDFANDPETKEFLDNAYLITKSIFELINASAAFVSSLVGALVKAGGKEAIDQIAESLLMLAFVLDSDFGHNALKGLIDLFIFGTQVVTGLIIVILAIGYAITAVGAFFNWLWNDVLEPFFTWVGEKIIEFVDWITGAGDSVEDLGEAFSAVPKKITDAFKNAPTLLKNAGRAIIQGLIDGMESMFGSLGGVMGSAMNIIGRFLPGSPAKEGPLSGSGYSYIRGQHLVKDFAAGVASETSTLSSVANTTMGAINFGPGSIRVSYSGVTPSPDQARMTGSAIGTGISGQLAVRNTQLAVRTL